MRTTTLHSFRVARTVHENPKYINKAIDKCGIDMVDKICLRVQNGLDLKFCDDNAALIEKMEGKSKAKFYANDVIGNAFYNAGQKVPFNAWF